MMTLLKILIVGFALGPLTALVEAFTFSTLWSWFARAQYGDGPTFSTWFGAATIAATAINLALINVAREKTDPGRMFTTLVLRHVGVWIGLFGVLATSYAIGLVLGWV